MNKDLQKLYNQMENLSRCFDSAFETLETIVLEDLWNEEETKKAKKMDKKIKAVKKDLDKKMDKLVAMDKKRDKACGGEMPKAKKAVKKTVKKGKK